MKRPSSQEKEKRYEDKIFPAVVDRTIYDPFVRVGYIDYWQNKCEELEKNKIYRYSKYC